ncbi:MAG TPA: alpha-glucan family phosphorylase [Chitinophagaceae bacterium]|nr:alpha-glucan family phosphorylase [Chitinophagaceae bacterium]
MAFTYQHPYAFDPAYKTAVAYFSMEYAIQQPLKTYAGGLGFLAGAHMRSAHDTRQNITGIGILWKYGYYDQLRRADQGMEVEFIEKVYGFLQPTHLRFTISIAAHDVWVTAWYLPPAVFNTAPIFLLSTDLPENDYLSKTICHKLYDANPETRMAAAILLGAGGARLLELMGKEPAVYHLNESHALPLAFYLYKKFQSKEEVQKRLVYTNHTPEAAGNLQTNIGLLEKLGFFCGVETATLHDIAFIRGAMLDHTLTALKLCGKANAVSKKHYSTLLKMWPGEPLCNKFISITNAQHFHYWQDEALYAALAANDDAAMVKQKQRSKQQLFEIVADQAGEIYDPAVLTIVFAKRFAAYKRADLLLYDMERFKSLVTNQRRPVQIIWAGKPYPMDYTAIAVFDKIANLCKEYSNCAILAGYELRLSKALKRGADLWLNLPRLTHEASGTSGMSAAMNGAINCSTLDGWMPEFAKDKVNAFIIPPCDENALDHLQDAADAAALYDLLEQEVLPCYYDQPAKWQQMIKNSLHDIIPYFDSDRMVRDYYQHLYTCTEESSADLG